MDDLQTRFSSILRENLHITSAPSLRQDQWYKRKYQSWKQDNGGQDARILAPTRPRDEWVPQVYDFASMFARTIEESVRREQRAWDTQGRQLGPRLFEDSALDGYATAACWSSDPEIVAPEKPALTPEMQPFSYWTSAYQITRRGYANAVKALLCLEQIGPLLRLAREPRAQMQEAARFYGRLGNGQNVEAGWETLLDQVLESLVFIMCLRAFPHELVKGKGYEYWVPWAFRDDQAALRRYVALRAGGKVPTTEAELSCDTEWLFRVLCKAHYLMEDCNSPLPNWERRVAEAVLQFVGFESWNREREHDWYLRCNLNRPKNEAWMRRITQRAEGATDHGESKKAAEATSSKPPKPKDPLLLRGKAQQTIEEPDESDDEQSKALAEMELKEAAYGFKRSTKYRRR